MKQRKEKDRQPVKDSQIRVGEPKPAGAKELARRRRLVEKTLKLREEIGPVDFSIAEVVRTMREGEKDERG